MFTSWQKQQTSMGFITEVTTSLQRSESPRSQRLTARISMSVSKPLWIRGSWEPPNVSSHSLLRENPVDPRFFLGGRQQTTQGLGLASARWFQESSWGKKLKEMKVGLFPSGNCMKPQQLCKDDSFVQKTDSVFVLSRRRLTTGKSFMSFLDWRNLVEVHFMLFRECLPSTLWLRLNLPKILYPDRRSFLIFSLPIAIRL